MIDYKPIHFNLPQLRVMLTGAQETYGVMSRGIGKSSGIIAPWLYEQARVMPRSQGGVVGATFQQLLVRTLPPAIAMWEKMGLKRNTHWVMGHEPPEKLKKIWNWQGPRTKPLDSKYAIYWMNGSCQILISQDRVGSSNGLSLAYLANDEAKLTNKKRLDEEVLPTLRGDRMYFGELSNYGGQLYLTDMPTRPDSMWILDKENLMDKDKIDAILELRLTINNLITQHNAGSLRIRKIIAPKIRKMEVLLNELRKGSILYIEANALDNIDVLGAEYIERMRQNLGDINFRTSIMNERLNKIEGGFYGYLDPAIHSIDWFNYSYLDQFIDNPLDERNTKQDSRHDSSFNPDEPIDITLDYGSDINCLLAHQERYKELRTGKEFYVLHPQLVEDVVQAFCDYYKHHRNKTATYIYDHTAIGGSGVSEYTYYDQVMNTLRKNGWSVREVYIGAAPKHHIKYDVINAILQEKAEHLPIWRYSKTNCQYLETSMLRAGIKKSSRGFEKDKTDERKGTVKSEEATHLSDAVDTYLYHKAQMYMTGSASQSTINSIMIT